MHVVIVTGGHLDLDFANKYLKTLSYDKVFAVDKGLEYTKDLNIIPDFIVGDFDTVNSLILKEYVDKNKKELITTEITKYPPEKDSTDTELALNKAIEIGANNITVLGGTGTRFDHVMGNIGILIQADRSNIHCELVDRTNRIRLLSSKNNICKIKRKNQFGTYLSIIPLDEVVGQLTLRGVKYPLNQQNIFRGSSLTISNEIIEEEAEISISNGNILVIESKD